MVELLHITKRFGSCTALNDVSAHFRSGECVALIGPNGCGKTTLIKSILGMVLPSSGEVLFNGKNISESVEYREHIGYMPQIGRYPDTMTIGNIIDMIREMRSGGRDTDTELYDAFALEPMLNKRMRTLSGGTTQKVSAVLAFLFQPDVLILDEPTAGLDPLASEILKEKIVAEKEKGKLILITSHLLNDLEDMASHVMFLREGIKEFYMPVRDLKSNTNEPTLAKAIASVLRSGMMEAIQ
ncbi:MAG: ABC transporter ATP-binding protein [Candidatus Kapabacteria bacterium]|nr:ABC transporter ATP-binding protein [Candidatus Kapabacteria bacterium]